MLKIFTTISSISQKSILWRHLSQYRYYCYPIMFLFCFVLFFLYQFANLNILIYTLLILIHYFCHVIHPHGHVWPSWNGLPGPIPTTSDLQFIKKAAWVVHNDETHMAVWLQKINHHLTAWNADVTLWRYTVWFVYSVCRNVIDVVLHVHECAGLKCQQIHEREIIMKVYVN